MHRTVQTNRHPDRKRGAKPAGRRAGHPEPASHAGPGRAVLQLRRWGRNRVRLNTIQIDDPKARHRGGFYLHDSVKGYTHGCVEVEPRFFIRLREYAAAAAKKGRKLLVLRVKYPHPQEGTYGGTLGRSYE